LDNEISVREISVPSYDPDSPERRAAIVGRLPVRDGSPAQARQDAKFVLSELRRHYASATAYERRSALRESGLSGLLDPGGGRGWRIWWLRRALLPPGRRDLPPQAPQRLEDELSATTEDHVAELVGKAAPVKVYIESFS
jgi:hypothetical protein